MQEKLIEILSSAKGWMTAAQVADQGGWRSAANVGVALQQMEKANGSTVRRKSPTGIAIELPEGFEGQVRPRSGMAKKHGVTVLNSPGTVDADYRSEIGVILINLSEEAYKIVPNDRIAQLVIAPVCRVEFVQVGTLSETERGDGAYGSTGR